MYVQSYEQLIAYRINYQWKHLQSVSIIMLAKVMHTHASQ